VSSPVFDTTDKFMVLHGR